MKKRNTAFTLIELSIVVVLIGILTAGIMQGSSLVKKANLSKARKLTLKSEVRGIKDLAVWVETSLPESIELDSAGKVTKWKDINPNDPEGVNATPFSSGTAPEFVAESINDLPSIKFSGAEYLLWDQGGNGLNMLVGSNYSIFIVEQRTSDSGYQFIFGGSSSNLYEGLHIGYRNSTTVTNDRGGNGVDCTVPSLSNSPETSRIHTALFSSSTITLRSGGTFLGTAHYTNDSSYCNNTPITYPLTAFPDASIAQFRSIHFYSGYLSEIIIFTRYLGESDRKKVESYLGKKYDIKVN